MNKKLISIVLAVLTVLYFIAIWIAIDKKNEKENENNVEQLQMEVKEARRLVEDWGEIKKRRLIEWFEELSGIKYNPIWKNKDRIITEEEVKAKRKKIEAELKHRREIAKILGYGDRYEEALLLWTSVFSSLDETEVLRGFLNFMKY